MTLLSFGGSPKEYPRVLIWAVLGIFLFLPACSTGPIVSQVVVEDATRMIRVDVTYRTGKDEHSHPASLSIQELDHALQSIRLEPSSLLPIAFPNGESEALAFGRKEREFLASHAVQALGRATPLEEVMFFWIHTRANNIREVTSGSLFVQDDDLHLVLANFKFTTTSQGEVDRAKRDPLDVLGQTLYFVDPGGGGRTHQATFLEKWFSQPHQHLIIPLMDRPSQPADLEEKISPLPTTPQETPPSLRGKLRELQALRNEGGGHVSLDPYAGQQHSRSDVW